MPDDGSCLLLIEGESVHAVRSVIAGAAIDIGGTVAALTVDDRTD